MESHGYCVDACLGCSRLHKRQPKFLLIHAWAKSSMKNLVVVCADVGSVAKGNFGWWSSREDSGTKPSTLANHVATALASGIPVALGFECPLFVPLLNDEHCLTKARPGEGSRAWSAGAGCGALATGLVQVTWLLQEVRQQLAQQMPVFLSWHSFAAAGSGLLIWEAFVSGAAKRESHTADARAGAEAFMRALPDPTQSNAVICNSDVYSLAGAAILRANWSTDLHILQEPCLVVRADVA